LGGIKETLMRAASTHAEPNRTGIRIIVGRWYYPGMAVAMIAVVIASFSPSIVDPSRRLAPMTPLVAAHGIFFFLWLILFLFQTTLIATRHVSLHQRMGIVAVALLCVLVPLSYVVTVQMVRRGFDLSGDARAKADPLFNSIFNFVSILELPVLAGAALAYRRRTAIHKRLMLFTNIMLMEVPITHLFGHIGRLSPLTVPAGTALFFVAAMAGDYLESRRIHPLTTALSVTLFLLLPIQGIFGTTATWHRFAAWLTS
jgi:hypothetical protein